MKIIFVISPDYLDSIFKEAKKYDFSIQGYSTVQDAAKGLLKTNVFDILGFVFVSRTLPKDLSVLHGFMELCNSMQTRRKFLFALNDNSRLFELFRDGGFQYLDIAYLNEIEVMTDIEINQNIFGSILKYNYDPYKLDDKERPSLAKGNLPRLEYRPIINKYPLNVLEGVHVADTVDNTLKYDKIYGEYRESENPDESLCKLRELYVKVDYSLKYKLQNKAELLEEIRQCDKLISDLCTDNTLLCIYKSLLTIIKDRLLEF